MLGLAGVMEMDRSDAGVTVSVVDPVMLPDVAVMVVLPAATPEARPLEPPALLIVATAGADEFQVTDAVRTCVVPSEYVPVAVNCRVVPLAMLGLAGVIDRDTSVADVTVSVVDPEMLPDVALIVVEPAAFDEAKPEALIVAAPVLDDIQVTDVVKSWVVLSENVPIATNCSVVPLAMLGFTGVIAMDTSVVQVTVMFVVPDLLPHFAETTVLPQPLPDA